MSLTSWDYLTLGKTNASIALLTFAKFSLNKNLFASSDVNTSLGFAYATT